MGGPRLLSFYVTHLWQACRRDGAYDMTCLTGVHSVYKGTLPAGPARHATLFLEFSNKSAEAYSVLEGVETVELRVPGGIDCAREWERHLLSCIEYSLLDACLRCNDYCGLADTALRILVRAQVAAAEGRLHVNVDRVRQPGTGATPLMLVAQAGSEQLCTHLLMTRADPSLVDENGMTAMSLAIASGHNKVQTLLSNRGVLPVSPKPTLLSVSQPQADSTDVAE